MRAMTAEHTVRCTQPARYPDCNRFLPDAEMDRTADATLTPHRGEMLLRHADALHVAQLLSQKIDRHAAHVQRLVAARRIG